MYQRLDKFKLPSNFRGRNVLVVQLWWVVEATLFSWSPQFMYGWRRFLLRLFGASIGSDVIVRPSVKTTYPWKLSIGKNSWIGDDVTLYTLGEIFIGDNVVVSQRSYLCTGSHDYRSKAFDIYEKPIVVESKAWLATDVYIAPGVTIGRGTVVGARSSVFSDMPEEMICLGSPAKPIKSRFD
ncbi:MAG: WcaF family extracellular polysaccharide biosynthesis acetyltransferase [Gammaproteobacteria bacterium]|nr:WcaF family extracellular polysaccharide biosynthesis acetyltransferase [Gammaproteobacteria bacterium]